MPFQTLVNRAYYFHKENRNEIHKHLIAWAIFYIVDFCFVIGFSTQVNSQLVLVYLSTVFIYILCFYSLVGIYVEYLPEQKLRTALTAFGIILLSSILNSLWGVYVIKYERAIYGLKASPLNVILLEIWRFSTSAMYAFAYWIYLQRIKEQELRIKTEKQLYKAKLDFLNAQINPHFLFNTLNFVYGDVASKSKKAGDAILGLTNLLRYTVESTKSEKSSLKKEIDAIEEFIKLQRVRFGPRLQLNFEKNVTHAFFAIPPLVLISMIENAFKYGIIDDPNNPIQINLEANHQSLTFRCANAVRQDFVDKSTTAVGIANIRSRLDLIYRENYSLIVHNTDILYEVKLNVLWNN